MNRIDEAHREFEEINFNESSTKFPVNATHEEFLRFLDTDFRPEINLSAETEDLFTGRKVEIAKNNEIKVEEVNLTYRGHKHMFSKGKYAERGDVVYKTFIRAVRRFLWTLFEQDFDVSLLKDNKNSDSFKLLTKKFYEKYFKQYVDFEIDTINVSEDEICFILSTLMTNKYSFAHKTDKHRKFISQFELIYHKFSKWSYQKFFDSEKISFVFKLLMDSGIVARLIKAYPKLSESNEVYLKVAKNIIDFKDTKTFLK